MVVLVLLVECFKGVVSIDAEVSMVIVVGDVSAKLDGKLENTDKMATKERLLAPVRGNLI